MSNGKTGGGGGGIMDCAILIAKHNGEGDNKGGVEWQA